MAEERMLITGGQRLEGTVHVSGGKNTSVAVISASILSQTPCVIENLPNIEDVNVSVETLRHLGAKVIWLPTNTAENHYRKNGKDPSKGVVVTRDGKAVDELQDILHRCAAGALRAGAGASAGRMRYWAQTD